MKSSLAGVAVLPLARTGLSKLLLHHERADAQDLALLEDLQRSSFEFFWNEADPHSGLVRDRANADGGDTRHMSSIAATGFGLAAMCIGSERGYRSPAEIAVRVRITLDFLANNAPHVHGFLYHYVDMRNGKRLYESEVSPIDMAILLCGVLSCRQYFRDQAIRRDATHIYERIEWPWALDGHDSFALDWTPDFGFSTLRWDSYSECMMMYLLAIASSTHPIPARCWHSFQRPWVDYASYRFISGPAPLFIHQFSHAWFDFRGRRDEYTNYFENSVTAVQAHRRFCMDLSSKFESYSEKCWGVTASDSSSGYVAWGGPPIQGPIDGTIVPAAAAGSLPFLFHDSLVVLRHLRDEYGTKIWKRYGFVDAFNPLSGWTDSDVVGIDAGISMVMAENARSQLVWKAFMQNREARLALSRAGFRA